MIDRHILDFPSETTERNLTKQDRQQELNVLYQENVFFGTIRKLTKMVVQTSD